MLSLISGLILGLVLCSLLPTCTEWGVSVLSTQLSGSSGFFYTSQIFSATYSHSLTDSSLSQSERPCPHPRLVLFSSGDFHLLDYEVFGSDTNITVSEVTKGQSNMETFTLLWGGVPTKPIAYNASKTEVCKDEDGLLVL